MSRLGIVLLVSVSALAFASVAPAADLVVDEPLVDVVQTAGDWEGMFVGVFGGYGWGTSAIPACTICIDLSGWLVGVDAGANVHLRDGFVAGIVGDIAWSDVGGVDPAGIFEVDWAGSLRGRLGFDGGAFMPYLTGGLAVAGATADATGLGGGTDSATHIGWTVGAGVEIAATEDLTLDLLYRYSDYGTQTYNTGGGDFDANVSTHQATAGLNWHF